MPLLKKREKFSTTPKNETDETSSPNMNKVEKWLDEVEEKTEFEEVLPESEEWSPNENKPKQQEVAIEKPVEKTKEKVIKKNTRIGFRRKEKKLKEETKDEEILPPNLEEMDDTLSDSKTEKDLEKKAFSSNEKKTIIKKDMKDKPVFLEDTGEKLGTVFDTIYDENNNLIGYKIKDKKSDAVLSFPSEQFDHNKDGLIFIPGWYNNSVKIIEKLEFKDKVSPDLTALLSDDADANEELYEIFVKHDDEMANYIVDAISLKEIINNRLRLLEKQRLVTKNDLMDLTERRLIKDIDRREFSEEILRHRRKVNILDINIKKCKDLLKRLENTSFGVLGKLNIKHDLVTKQEEQFEKNLYKDTLEDSNTLDNQNIGEGQDSYKEKYFELKEQYEQLEDDFQDLKLAVDKLFTKADVED